MKIVKRDLGRPAATATLWVIPIISYTMQKAAGITMTNLEWLWWVTIPTMFVLWLAINYKIVK
jgi:hypothetical protein